MSGTERGRTILLVVLSVVLTYSVAVLTLMTRWISFWIRGSYYVAYQAIFLTLLSVLLVLWVRHHNGARLGLSTVAFAMLAGYGAGVIASVLHPIFQPDGLQLVLLSLSFPAPEALVAFFWFPAKILSWLFGGIAGAALILLSRRLPGFG